MQHFEIKFFKLYFLLMAYISRKGVNVFISFTVGCQIVADTCETCSVCYLRLENFVKIFRLH